jgi:hypothetical protein
MARSGGPAWCWGARELVASRHAGALRRSGNWPAVQIFGYLATRINYDYEGYPSGPLGNSDCNRDRSIDSDDINPFVEILSYGPLTHGQWMDAGIPCDPNLRPPLPGDACCTWVLPIGDSGS